MREIDPDIAKTVSQLQGIVHKKIRLENDTKLTPAERQDEISKVQRSEQFHCFIQFYTIFQCAKIKGGPKILIMAYRCQIYNKKFF